MSSAHVRPSGRRLDVLLLGGVCVLILSLGSVPVKLLGGPAPPADTEYEERKQKLEEDHLKGLMGLASQARKNKLDPDARRFANKVLKLRADHEEAKGLLKEIGASESKGPDPQTASRSRRQLWTSEQQLLKKTVDGYQALTTWCEKKGLKAEKTAAALAGLVHDPNNRNFHLAAGHKLNPDHGWVDADTDGKLRANQRLWKKEWKPWTEIQKERHAEFTARVGPKLGPTFRCVITPHLNIASNVQNPAYARQILEDLQLLVRDQHRAFYGPIPLELEPYDAIVFDREAQFEDFATKEGGNRNSMGYYDSGKRCLFAWHVANPGRGFDTNEIGTPLHELTHGLLKDFLVTGKLPVWLNEGFASFFEMARTRNGVFNFGAVNTTRMRRLREALGQGRPFDLEGLLLLSDPARFHDKDDILNYNRAAMLMHFLHERGKLREFLHEYKANRDAEDALRYVLGEDLRTLEAQITVFAAQKLR